MAERWKAQVGRVFRGDDYPGWGRRELTRRKGCAMFERFTDQAKHAVVHAQQAARGFDHDYIGAEHLLIGVFRVATAEGAPATMQTLERLGLGADEAVARVPVTPGSAKDTAVGHIPFTTEAKSALESAFREALELGGTTITPDHLLLGIVRAAQADSGSVAARALRALGLDAEPVRTALGRTRITLSRTASKTLARAGMEARHHRHDHVETAHLLLALLAVDPDLCRRVFDAAGADPELVRAELVTILGTGEGRAG
ncbi:hypothetical protein F6W96_11555 [Nocardia terpenica]|uniref:Clp R domain-containing protein n=2 Tax=Nocardia terpenica TaxID=455432 RepID=A0A6G9YZR6_9NOCA|nr:hypothetical protein F6W96_11555 [Nocardia terpenica]